MLGVTLPILNILLKHFIKCLSKMNVEFLCLINKNHS